MSMNPPATAIGHADPTIDDPRQRRAILIAACVAQPELAIEVDARGPGRRMRQRAWPGPIGKALAVSTGEVST
jgi:hypothetical protein